MSFDALGRQTAWGTTSYSYDSLDRVATRDSTAFGYTGVEIDPATVGGEIYSRTPAGDLLAAQVGGAARLVGKNRHGDVAWLLGPAGQVTDTRIWDPYGQTAGTTGTTAASVGYQGDYTDPDTGQVWMGARWYQPGTATFTARDTVFGQLQTPVTLNRYTYANGDPLAYFDPDGREADPIGWVKENILEPVVNWFNETVVQPAGRVVTSGMQSIQADLRTLARTVPPVLQSLDIKARQLLANAAEISRINTASLAAAGAQIAGIGEGLLAGTADNLTGMAQLAANPAQLITLGRALRNDPLGTTAALIQGFTAPIQTDIQNGDYGKALGRGLAGALDPIIGAKGTGRLGKASHAARRLDAFDNATAAGRVSRRIDPPTRTTRRADTPQTALGRDPIFVDNDVLVKAQGGHAGALAEIRAGTTYVTPNQYREFLNVTSGRADRLRFLKSEGVQLFGGSQASRVAAGADFQKTFRTVLAAGHGRGDAALLAFARQTGFAAVTSERALSNLVSLTLRDPSIPIARLIR